ncbi:hypothetical protein [Marinobacter sp. NSM]|uniref:hypothetical protein n=1 Tax=Marinobacter sp. NSM TaxID=3458004 RepID=UPI004036A5DE
MEFRRWHNMVYAELGEYATFDQVGIVTSTGIEYSLWLGIADRRIIRRLPDARGVLLDIESWRCMILDSYKRLGPGVYMVGAVIADLGVLGVMDGRKPLLKLIEPERDRLKR